MRVPETVVEADTDERHRGIETIEVIFIRAGAAAVVIGILLVRANNARQ